MKPNYRSSICCSVLAAASALALSASAVGQIRANVSGPVLGYVLSSAEKALRPLQGVIGSATVGKPVNLNFAVGQALSLGSNNLIVSSDSNEMLLNLSMETNPPAVSVIPAPAWPAVSVSASKGTAAAFYYPGNGAYVVTGLPKNPAALFINLGVGDGTLTHMAVAGDGSLLVYAVKDETGESIYSWTAASGAGRLIGSAVSIGDMTLTANGGVIIADRAASEVFAVWDVRGAASREFLLGAGDGVSSPSSLTVSDRNDIYVGNAGAVMTLDSAGRLKRSQSCACTPSGFYWMRDSLFRMTDRLDQTVYLLNAGDEDRIFFVPPPTVTP
jgi:hypothetical protein